MIYNNNRLPFPSIVKGIYGRKIAYTDVSVITPDNVVSVVGSCLSTFYFNRTAIEYLWNYYKGNQPVLYRTKENSARDDIVNHVVENHSYEIVQFKTSQTYGEPVQFISRKDDDVINDAVDQLNDYMTDVDKHAIDICSGEWQSATGTSFKAIQKVENQEIPFRIIVPSPLDTFIIYSRETGEPMLSVEMLKDDDGEYKRCFSNNMEFYIRNSKVISYQLHGFGDIPIVEYPNNWERLSDIELVITILDSINSYQSDRVDAVDQFVQSWIKFVNCEIDEETFKKMKMMGALVVKSNNGSDAKADVEVMSQELNQSQTQIAKDDLWDNALSILAIPNKQTNTGGDTAGAVALRNGWDFSKNRAKLKDPIVKASEKKLAKLVLNRLRITKKELKMSFRDFDVQINHSPTDNMIVKTQSLQYLLQCGIHPAIAIATIGLFSDPEKVYINSQPYLKALWKTVDDAEIEKQLKDAQDLLEQYQKNLVNEPAATLS